MYFPEFVFMFAQHLYALTNISKVSVAREEDAAVTIETWLHTLRLRFDGRTFYVARRDYGHWKLLGTINASRTREQVSDLVCVLVNEKLLD